MPQYLDRLPIGLPAHNQRHALEQIAQRAMKDGYEAIKKDLNIEVYKLYGLTDDEIAIVENKA